MSSAGNEYLLWDQELLVSAVGDPGDSYDNRTLKAPQDAPSTLQNLV